MGHQICAIIGKKPINEDTVKKYQLAIAYEDNFAIVILERESIYYWGDKLNLSFDSESDTIDWACELTFFFAKELGIEKYAIIQTDYFSGMGSQCASLYENGKAVIKEKDINEALHELGVSRTHEKDEFDMINLSEYRASEYYYWETSNFADKQSNMIAGKIPKDFD
jgi:hypothetical protein